MTRPEILPHGVLEAEGRQRFAGTYGWTCEGCRHWNPPDARICFHCGSTVYLGLDDVRTAIRGAIALREREIADDLEAALALADADTAQYDLAYSRAKGGVEEIIRRLRGQS